MSDNEFLADDDQEQPSASDGGSLRKFGETQKKRADALDKQLAELKAELAKRDAAAVFTELGVPEKVRKFYSGDYTKDAISAWMKEYADVFGFNTEVTQTPEQVEQRRDLESVTQATLAGQDRQTALSKDAMQAMSKDLLSKGANLDDVLAKMGVPNTPIQAPQF